MMITIIIIVMIILMIMIMMITIMRINGTATPRKDGIETPLCSWEV